MTTIRDQAKEEALKKLEGRKSLHETMTDEQKDFFANYDGPIEIGISETIHPHSTKEYVEWMAGVWKANDERNKKIHQEHKKMQLLEDIAASSDEWDEDHDYD